MKTIGVLGGIGPQATMDFEARVHAVSQRLIPQRGNSGYPPMVVYYLRHSPVLLTDGATGLVPVFPLRPDPRLVEAAARLSAWADFLVMTSNTPYLFQREIEEACGCQILSIIDVTLEEVKRRQIERVGVLGLGEPKIYQSALGHLGIEWEILPGERRDRLDRSIFALMEGRAGSESRHITMEAIKDLRSRGIDDIILACSEIPLLLNEEADDPRLINPAQLLAEASVRHALE